MVRHIRETDIPVLKELWKEAFGEEGTYMEDFFQQAASPERGWCYEKEGQTVAMLFGLPCEFLNKEGKREKACYFYALATFQSERGKGFMGELIGSVLKELEEQEITQVFLLPARESLFAYYERFGFSMRLPFEKWKMEENTNRNVFFEEPIEDLYKKWNKESPGFPQTQFQAACRGAISVEKIKGAVLD